MIHIKTAEEIKIMKEGGKILSKVLNQVGKMVEPGITTNELNKAAEALILANKAAPSFKGYQGFPAALCTSINEEIVHCYPSERRLQEGDIVSLDLGVFYNGFHTDMAITVPVGKVSLEVHRLIWVTRKALKRGIKKVRSGNTTGDIGNTIERYVTDQGLGLVRDLCGHGIGKNVHEDPQIPNFGKRGSGSVLKEGMVICIEPMVTMGDWNIKKAKDGYGISTKDNSIAAHFEHTMVVTKDGCEVITE